MTVQVATTEALIVEARRRDANTRAATGRSVTLYGRLADALEAATQTVTLGTVEHHTRQEMPWPPSPESTYMLTKWVCSCGWQSLTVTDQRGNPALEVARASATRHEQVGEVATNDQ